MSDLYGDGAVDILKYIHINESDVIRVLLHEVKQLKEENQAVKEQMVNYLEESQDKLLKLELSHREHLAYMDDIARDNDIQVVCRRCGERYELPVELSEFNEEGNYCNRGHGGTYHCAP